MEFHEGLEERGHLHQGLKDTSYEMRIIIEN